MIPNAKFTLTFLLNTLLILSPAGAAEKIELKLATTPWPPFTGEPSQPRIVIEIVEEALRRAGISSSIAVVKEGTLTQELKERRYDGSPAMWRDKDRETFLEYSAPLLENRLVLVGRKGANVSAKTFADLKGKRVGIVTGYAYGDEVAAAKNTIFVKGPSHQDNFGKLKRGEVDYLLVEDLLLQHVLKNQSKEARSHLEIGAIPLVKRTLHFVIRKDVPHAVEILRDFNAKLNSLLADGTYNRILKLSWIRADVDGDGKLELISESNHVGSSPPTDEYAILYSGADENTPAPHYWVDGQGYSNWEHVPAKYKVDEIARREKSDPFLQLKF